MAALSLVQAVECFHLLLLKMFEARLDRALYVVKGGVNLRAWFGSARYSDDMDLDVLTGRPYALRERIDAILASPAFGTLLASQALSVLRISKPKQTETTQRWKFELAWAGSSFPLHTKVEFSRRGHQDDFLLEAVRPEIVRPYALLPLTVNHYTAAAAARQKVAALAGRAQPQARDMWDLDHLLRTTGADPRPLPADLRRKLPEALDCALGLPYEAFKSQVVPYLTPEHQEIYGTRESWDAMCQSVAERLAELAE